jgi:UDP-3-O-[3-hydroxymyristoyl] N-acetylglucosamine deacetylase
MHKALDAIGDLFLIGYPILGSYSAFKSGHALNNNLVKFLIKNTDSWRVRSFASLKDAPLAWSKQWSWE